MLFSNGYKTYTYPIVFAFLKFKHAAAYLKLFKFLNATFLAKLNRELVIRCFKIDCESAVIRAINTIYPNSNIKLCLVHIARYWLKKLFKCVSKGATFYLENVIGPKKMA